MSVSCPETRLLSFTGTHQQFPKLVSQSPIPITGEYLFGYGVPLDYPPIVNCVRIPVQHMPVDLLPLDDTYCA
jgi:hypothetical protein